MTICIGAYTLTGPSIILSADTRGSYPSSYIPPNDQIGKQYPLPPYPCAVVVAGRATEGHEFIARLVQQFELLSKAYHPPFREEVMEAINTARLAVYRFKLDQALQREIGLIFAEWHSKLFPPFEFDYALEAHGMQTIRDNPLNMSSIVGGFIEDNVMFFCARRMEDVQSESSPDVHAIGSGSHEATEKLNKRGQNLNYSLARTIYHLHEAMLAAQRVRSVGPANNYLVLVKGQPVLHIPSDSDLLRKWFDYYEDKDSTASLDSESSNLGIQCEMKPIELPPYDRPLPDRDTASLI